jgi:hypothetical protein
MARMSTGSHSTHRVSAERRREELIAAAIEGASGSDLTIASLDRIRQ